MEWMFMPLKRYAEFSGRSRRQEFWMFMLLQFLIWMVAFVAMMVMGFGAMSMAGVNSDGTPRLGGMAGLFASMGIFLVIFGIIWLALFIPSLAVTVRRLHDTDRSGFWLLLPPAVYVVAIAVVLAGAANQSGTMTRSAHPVVAAVGRVDRAAGSTAQARDRGPNSHIQIRWAGRNCRRSPNTCGLPGDLRPAGRHRFVRSAPFAGAPPVRNIDGSDQAT